MYLVELEQGQRFWLHANKLRPYHARVNALIGNCAIVYKSDEEFGTLPVINSNQSDTNLPSNTIDPAKLEHLNADQKQAFLELLDEYADVLSSYVHCTKCYFLYENFVTRMLMILPLSLRVRQMTGRIVGRYT